MLKSKIINVKNNEIRVMKINETDYISLTDLAKYKEKDRTDYIIQNWMRNLNTIIFLGTWEYLNNSNFNSIEFDGFKTESGNNAFILTPKKWVESINAIGIISKQGRYGGTFAHPDIAFEFASWLSPEFKLYLIIEFERLKKKEAYQKKKEWKVSRLISKANYTLQTDAIKNYMVPKLTDKQRKFIYASEADVVNVALFGMTSKQWRKNNPDLKGNIRDYADILHLVILSNLESINSEMILKNIPQSERLIYLNKVARRQVKVLINNKSITKLESLKKMDNNGKLLIENKVRIGDDKK